MSCLFRVGNDGQRGENSLKLLSPRGLVRPSSPFHALPQFSHRDSGDFKLISRAEGDPAQEIECALFGAVDDVCVKPYDQLSTGGLAAFRAASRSRRQLMVSSSDKLLLAKTSAKSRPEQTFLPSGLSRATGDPFLSSTKVMSW